MNKYLKTKIFLQNIVRHGFYMYAGNWHVSVTYEHKGKFYAAYNPLYTPSLVKKSVNFSLVVRQLNAKKVVVFMLFLGYFYHIVWDSTLHASALLYEGPLRVFSSLRKDGTGRRIKPETYEYCLLRQAGRQTIYR
jgi:hypothetical protein